MNLDNLYIMTSVYSFDDSYLKKINIIVEETNLHDITILTSMCGYKDDKIDNRIEKYYDDFISQYFYEYQNRRDILNSRSYIELINRFFRCTLQKINVMYDKFIGQYDVIYFEQYVKNIIDSLTKLFGLLYLKYDYKNIFGGKLSGNLKLFYDKKEYSERTKMQNMEDEFSRTLRETIPSSKFINQDFAYVLSKIDIESKNLNIKTNKMYAFNENYSDRINLFRYIYIKKLEQIFGKLFDIYENNKSANIIRINTSNFISQYRDDKLINQRIQIVTPVNGKYKEILNSPYKNSNFYTYYDRHTDKIYEKVKGLYFDPYDSKTEAYIFDENTGDYILEYRKRKRDEQYASSKITKKN